PTPGSTQGRGVPGELTSPSPCRPANDPPCPLPEADRDRLRVRHRVAWDRGTVHGHAVSPPAPGTGSPWLTARRTNRWRHAGPERTARSVPPANSSKPDLSAVSPCSNPE